MRIAIVGDGKVGSALTEQLAKEGHDIVVIDSNKAVLREAVEELRKRKNQEKPLE